MQHERIPIIDFVRGLVIVDMMLVHYEGILSRGVLSKIINYTDVAIEGFIFLAGYVIGSVYFPMFLRDKAVVVMKLVKRVLGLIKLQYLMVLTISLPIALMMGTSVTGGDTLPRYIMKSLLFLKQEGLMHILPIFIPLFLMAIPIFYLLSGGHDRLVILLSALFFIIGNYHPYLFSIGERAIFPVILWQIYFVCGILLGKMNYPYSNRLQEFIKRHVFLAAIVFGVSAFLYFGHHVVPELAPLRDHWNVKVSKFPLNYLGLLYRGSLLYLLIYASLVLMSRLKGENVAVGAISLLGRHSLLAFVIHVYFAKSMTLTNHFTRNPFPLPQMIVLLNVVFTIFILKYIEGKRLCQETAPVKAEA